IKFCGAAQTVTGSSHLLTLNNGYTILLDCGLYQGIEDKFEDFNESWQFKPSEIDCVILSHAHIDHSGRLPKLVKDGFSGEI
ncbi:MAG: MBL fold metallo-hydrolase, partial [Chitinophagales bacterium]